MWTKIKAFFSWIWLKIKSGAKWILAVVIIVALAVAGIFAIVNKDDKTDSTDKEVEVAQIFEPSIGTPLPPDITETGGEVSGAQTETPSSSDNSSGIQEPSTQYVAPKTGVNDDEPFVYKNSKLGFQVSLAGGTQVIEASEGAQFLSKNGKLLFYTVMIPAKGISVAEISSQLNQSSGTGNIIASTFGNFPSVSFSQNHQNGLALITSDKLYYLVGDQNYFKNFSTIN